MSAISIVVPFSDRWYFSEVIRGASARIEQAEHEVRLHVIPPGSTSTREAGDLIEREFERPDTIGAIVGGFKYQADQGPRATTWKRPIVLVGGTVLGYPTVMIDDIGAAREVVEHLRDLGHRRIVHLAGALTEQMDFSVHGRRAKGYRLAMEAAGLSPEIVETEFDYQDAITTARGLLSQRSLPSAIFAVSDEIAFALLDAMRELGLRPGIDISVAGIDDHPRAEKEDLTTIRQQPAVMGSMAAEMLLDGLAAGLAPNSSRLAPISLIKRASTARARMDGIRRTA